MFKKPLLISAMASSLLLAFNPGFAADPPVQKQAQEQVYGSQLMTEQERAAYQSKMRVSQNQRRARTNPRAASQGDAGACQATRRHLAG